MQKVWRMDVNVAGKDDIDTRTKLLLAAERLFGARGIDGVPLHEVVAAAGQRNASALNYHVGGREDLLGAIIDYRRAEVDRSRVELLDGYVAAGVVMDERAVAAGIILPLSKFMARDPNGGHYLRFLTQIFVTDRPETTYAAIGRFDEGMRRCLRLYRACFVTVPPRLIRERFAACGRGAIYALADWERDRTAPRGGYTRSGLTHFTADLIAMTASSLACVGARDPRLKSYTLSRPISAATL